MNEQSKYRLVGAFVLIVVALLLIPLFLSHKPSKTSIELTPILLDETTQKSASPVVKPLPDSAVEIHGRERAVLPPPPALHKMKPQPVPPADVSPKPLANPLEAPAPSKQSSSIKSSEMVKQSVKKAHRHASAMGSHGWVTQVGLFSNRINADRLIHQLQSRGFRAHQRQISKIHTPKKQGYQVIIGPMAQTRHMAEKWLTKHSHTLEALHIKGFVVKI